MQNSQVGMNARTGYFALSHRYSLGVLIAIRTRSQNHLRAV